MATLSYTRPSKELTLQSIPVIIPVIFIENAIEVPMIAILSGVLSSLVLIAKKAAPAIISKETIYEMISIPVSTYFEFTLNTVRLYDSVRAAALGLLSLPNARRRSIPLIVSYNVRLIASS